MKPIRNDQALRIKRTLNKVAVTSLLASICLLIGCQKSQPPSQTNLPFDTAESSEFLIPLKKAKILWANKENDLLAQLESNPENASVLFELAKVNSNLGVVGNDEPHARAKKAADFLHRAIELDPKIAEAVEFREVGKSIFYNGACALSLDGNDEESLRYLRQSAEAGWSDLDELKTDSSLEHTRRNPGFADIEQAVRKSLAFKVERLFEAEHDFSFDFDLQEINGRRVTKEQYAGKLLMVYIWATWCPPCVDGVADVAFAAEKYKERGFEVVGINDEPEAAEEAKLSVGNLQEELGINFPCVLSDERTLNQLPDKKDDRPTSIFLDRHGKIAAVVRGQIKREKLIMIIERLQNGSSFNKDLESAPKN